MSESYVPPLPNERDYTAAVETVIKAGSIASKRALEALIQRRLFKYEGYSRGMRVATLWGELVEPYDRSLGAAVYGERTVGEAIRLGAGFGFAMIPLLHGGVATINEALDAVPLINKPTTKDPSQYHHEIADQVVELGEEGLTHMGNEATDRLEAVEERVVEQVAHQRMFRIGVGIVALGGHFAHNSRLEVDRRRMEAAAGAAIDWDGGLEALLS